MDRQTFINNFTKLVSAQSCGCCDSKECIEHVVPQMLDVILESIPAMDFQSWWDRIKGVKRL